MPKEDLWWFGDGRPEENSDTFIKKLFQRIGLDHDNASMFTTFAIYMASGHPGEEWYNETMDGDSAPTSWDELVKLFFLRWPKKKAVKKEKSEYYRLKEEELGTKVEHGGLQMWSHVAAADTLEILAKNAGIAETDFLIVQVRSNLLDVLKEKVSSKHANWAAFTKEIWEVDVEFIKDGAKRALKAKETERKIQELERERGRRVNSASNSPDAVAAQFANMNLSGQNNTGEQKRLIHNNLDILPQHPNTAEGIRAWEQQKITWAETHGGNTTLVNENRPYPLQPGTAKVCSGECFLCGKHGHYSGICPTPDFISGKEKAWRRLCTNALGSFRRNTEAVVAFVSPEYHMLTMEYQGGGDYENQGNGEGPTAHERLLSGESSADLMEYSSNDTQNVMSALPKFEIVRLYSVGHEDRETIPFRHAIGFIGAEGNVVDVTAFFDDGAMISAMSTTTFDRLKGILMGWGPSWRRLRMADDSLVPSVAHWEGTVVLGGISVQGEFEVFESGGKWEFLFGKPLLQHFHAIHDYDKDTIQIAGKEGVVKLSNVSLKKCGTEMGGNQEEPPRGES
ncbi:hypothetical protein K435DRAFT_884538 [Dendrothele bispora CBS 962.96]|uniref:CCHC-type domain-containing protein n=1 Tax=Dendrothele bispora (strain CBS 962.96) TaxID=1314807 RepID=A0A4S8KTP0_DENBC|nr:hypothetical protein K435DRAFT_884538 [Dendrothele bispora CBS 962.96]